MNYAYILCLIIPFLFCSNSFMPYPMVISVPVTDLRIKPIEVTNFVTQDMLQDSQLVYGETINVLEEKEGWLLVEALEQWSVTAEKKWIPMKGWVRACDATKPPASGNYNGTARKLFASIYSEPNRTSPPIVTLPCGSHVHVTPYNDEFYAINLFNETRGFVGHCCIAPLQEKQDSTTLRKKILTTAALFLGMPYRWGGRCPYDAAVKNARTSVDCSGLVELCYRACGKKIPRDAHPQWLARTPIKHGSLVQPADLIFLASTHNPKQIIHVMIYEGDDRFLDAFGRDIQLVRRTSFSKWLGKPLSTIASGDVAGEYVIYFGTYF